MVVVRSSIMYIAWKTVFESLRPQFQLLTLARFSHFTHATSTVARRTCTLPKLISVNLREIAVASEKHSNGRNHSNHSSTYGQIGPCSWGSVHKFLARSRLIVRRLHSTSVQDCKDPYCRRFLNTDTQDSDINRQSSIIALFPKQIQPYLFLARIDRPIGYWLLFLPGAWSISLAAEASSLPDLKLLTLFFVGSLLMRSAGCVINDLWDSDFDKMVRTSLDWLFKGYFT